jgi:transcriptional regulator of aromatic amino acid metabolism
MKKLILVTTLLCFTLGFAQNEDKMTKTVTTKTKVKSSKGEEVAVKEKKYTAKQKLQVQNNNETNQGVNREMVKLEESTTFSTGSQNYTIQPDKNGYQMMVNEENGMKKMYGKIRKMPNRDGYILVKENENSFGYFDENGNFIVESYDPVSDSVILKKYTIE